MNQNRRCTSENAPDPRPLLELTESQRRFASVVGQELARLWIEQQADNFEDARKDTHRRRSSQHSRLDEHVM